MASRSAVGCGKISKEQQETLLSLPGDQCHIPDTLRPAPEPSPMQARTIVAEDNIELFFQLAWSRRVNLSGREKTRKQNLRSLRR